MAYNPSTAWIAILAGLLALALLMLWMRRRLPLSSIRRHVFGLTGNVACGKSTVARLLRERGIPVIDADQLARDAMDPSTAMGKAGADAVLQAFGTLDRKTLRDLAFGDPVKRRKLEAILHPLILKLSRERMREELRHGAKAVVYEAPLLFEAGRERDTGGVIVVTCAPEMQLERMLARDPALAPELAARIRGAQMPQEEKARRARWVVDNSGTEEELREKIDLLAREIMAR